MRMGAAPKAGLAAGPSKADSAVNVMRHAEAVDRATEELFFILPRCRDELNVYSVSLIAFSAGQVNEEAESRIIAAAVLNL
jgi:hypothetical protein